MTSPSWFVCTTSDPFYRRALVGRMRVGYRRLRVAGMSPLMARMVVQELVFAGWLGRRTGHLALANELAQADTA